MKTIFITGSTDGIGKLAAVELAKAGHEVFLHGRSKEKLAGVMEEVKSLSKNEKVAFGNAHPDAYDGAKIMRLLEVTEVLTK